jgi:hypothetical protein
MLPRLSLQQLSPLFQLQKLLKEGLVVAILLVEEDVAELAQVREAKVDQEVLEEEEEVLVEVVVVIVNVSNRSLIARLSIFDVLLV